MVRKTKDVQSALERKGFRLEKSHHRYYIYFSTDGKKTIVSTYTSHGSKEINDYLLGQMAKQCKLAKPDFKQLLDCPMSQAAYESALIQGGHISKPDTASKTKDA